MSRDTRLVTYSYWPGGWAVYSTCERIGLEFPGGATVEMTADEARWLADHLNKLVAEMPV